MFYKILMVGLLVVLLLAGCSVDQIGEGLPFFEGYTWETLVGFFFALFFGLLPGFNLFQWLKETWGLEGQKAHYMVLSVSVLLTVGAMLVTGAFDLSGFEFTLENVLTYASFVYAGSQIAYQRFKAGRKEPLAADPE